MNDTPYRYGTISVILHWFIALLVIGNLIVGLLLDDIPMPQKIAVINFHKATGSIVLAFMFLRLLWRLRAGFIRMPDAIERWQQWAARAAHILFYPLLLALPLSGWLLSSAAGYPISVYGLFTLPMLMEKNPELAKFFAQSHGVLAYAVIALLAAHIGGVVYHAVRHKINLLRRMA